VKTRQVFVNLARKLGNVGDEHVVATTALNLAVPVTKRIRLSRQKRRRNARCCCTSCGRDRRSRPHC